MNAGSLRVRRVSVALVWLLLMTLLSAGSAMPAAAIEPSSQRASDLPTRLEGYLREINSTKWVVGDVSVLVDARTVLLEKRGKAEVGAWVIVWGTRDATGSLYAELIQVDRAAGLPGPELQFTGVVRKILGNEWVIEQILVQVTDTTQVTGEPGLGSLVWVVAEQQGDSFRAAAIQMISCNPAMPPVDFEGKIEAFNPERWLVDGHEVIITPDTEIIGTPAVDKNAEVRAQPQSDGRLIGLILRVMDPAAEARLGVVVTSIATNSDGSETWHVLVFSKTTGDMPVASTLRVDGRTYVDEHRAVAKSGQWAEITALKLGAAEYQADMIHLEHPAPVLLTGTLTPLSTKPGARGWWWLNGQPVWWLPAEAGAAASLLDKPVTISGVRLGNGVIWVNQIGMAPSQTE